MVLRYQPFAALLADWPAIDSCVVQLCGLALLVTLEHPEMFRHLLEKFPLLVPLDVDRSHR